MNWESVLLDLRCAYRVIPDAGFFYKVFASDPARMTGPQAHCSLSNWHARPCQTRHMEQSGRGVAE
jgi:hypothetical protein